VEMREEARHRRGMGALFGRFAESYAQGRSTTPISKLRLSQSKGRLFPGPRRLPDRARYTVN